MKKFFKVIITLSLSLSLLCEQNLEANASSHTHTSACKKYDRIYWHRHSDGCMGYCGKYLPYTTSSNELGHGYVYKCTGCGNTTSIGHQYQGGCSCNGSSPVSYVQWYDGSYRNIMTQFYRDNLEHNGAICGMEEFNFYDEQGNLLQEGTPWGEEDSIYTEVPICYKIITDLKPIK